MTIRSKYRLQKHELQKKGHGTSRLTGLGSLVLVDNIDLAMSDLEMEDIWLML
jgi:hypothetical protein